MKSALKKILAAGSAVAVIGSLLVTAFASGGGADGAITDIVSMMLGYVVDMFKVVGVLVAVYAVAQFALAFKDDNPDQKSRSTVLLVVGAMLLGMGTFANKIAGYAGVSIGKGFL